MWVNAFFGSIKVGDAKLEIATKAAMLRYLLAHHQYMPVYELLRRASNTEELGGDDSSEGFSDSRLVRLLGNVRNHLLFVSKYGEAIAHVEDEVGCHHFSFPEKLEEWLALNAPGLTQGQVEHEYFKLIKAKKSDAT